MNNKKKLLLLLLIFYPVIIDKIFMTVVINNLLEPAYSTYSVCFELSFLVAVVLYFKYSKD